jgi:hypothetical protein
MALFKTARWLVFLALACGASASPAAAPEPEASSAPDASPPPGVASPESGDVSAAAADTYPTPYTAEQIRAATLPGRAYTWRVEMRGKPAVERTIVFTQVDAEGAEITSDGVAKRVTWEELRRHAEFPRALVTTRQETVTVAAGTYDCIVYVIAGPAAAETSTFYFAKAMPGAPVLFFTDNSGVRQLTNELVHYVPGTGG